MIKTILKTGLFVLLVLSFGMLFIWLGEKSIIRNVLHRTFESLDMAARRRVQENRRMLLLLQRQSGLLHRIEKSLIYSGLAGRLPFLTPELWILLNLALSAGVYFIILLWGGKLLPALGGAAAVQVLRHMVIGWLMGRNYRSVDDNLLKFLDFLGNYSITAGEVTGILNQISKYLDEPLKSVLDECYYEAQTSGDAGLALLTMTEKIEHQGFRELVRNIEISARYSADFTSLVSNSRRAVREQMRMRQERKAMVKEAMVNMLILAFMSLFILFAVEQLIGASVRDILFGTIVGRICLSAVAVIFALLYGQIRKIDR